MSMFGEGSPFHTNAEFNYLALQYFANDPDATVEQFADEVMAPRLGGKTLAEAYLKIAVEGKSEPEKVPVFSKEIAKFLAGLQEQEAIRRWFWLASYLNSVHWESTQKGYVKRDDKLVVL